MLILKFIVTSRTNLSPTHREIADKMTLSAHRVITYRMTLRMTLIKILIRILIQTLCKQYCQYLLLKKALATTNRQEDSMAKWKCHLNFCGNRMVKTPVTVYTAVIEDTNSSNGPNSNSTRRAPSSSAWSNTQPLTHNVNGKREPDILGPANNEKEIFGNGADIIAEIDKLLSEARKKADVTLGNTSTIPRSPKGKQGKTDDRFRYVNPNHRTNHECINRKNGNISGDNNGPISRLRKFRKDCHSVREMSRVRL